MLYILFQIIIILYIIISIYSIIEIQKYNKNGFINNLSIIDLIFNEGPNSISFLK